MDDLLQVVDRQVYPTNNKSRYWMSEMSVECSAWLMPMKKLHVSTICREIFELGWR